MIMQLEFVSSDMIAEALAEVKKKKKPATSYHLRFDAFVEGSCAQILHVGPFSEEGPTVEKVHHFIETIGQRQGKHHEIYLSDVRKADPAKWKTIIRQPFAYSQDRTVA